MLALLKERGYVAADTKSVSSTVSKIYIEEIEKELASKAFAAAPVAATPASPEAVTVPAERHQAQESRGHFCEDGAGRRPRARGRGGGEGGSARARPRRLLSQRRPPPRRPRGRSPRASAPASAGPQPGGRQGRPRRSRPSGPFPPPRRLSSPRNPPRAPRRRPARRPCLSARPSFPRPLPQMTAAPSAPPLVTVEGDIKIIHLKPPVIVRDFAVALSLKPFKLISELNQMGGFASMNSTIDEAVAQKVAEKYGFVLDIKHRGDVAQQQAKDKGKAKPVAGRVEGPGAAAPGGRHPRPRRPRQDLAPRRHPQGERGRGRGRRNHPAHRRLPGRAQRPQDHLSRHPGPRRIQQDARPRRLRHRHRGPRGRGRRRIHAADRRGPRARPQRQGRARSSPSTRWT